MPNSLLTGVSGMLAHQRLLDIVGNNIANANTPGFKSQRALFSDLFYETIRPATGGGDGDTGGVNPNQIGGGVKLALTDRKFGQGGLENTGEQFDVAISGNGFFVVSNAEKSFLTRSGMFTVDSNDNLVAPGGLKVQRLPGIGEPDETGFGFQTPGDSSIRIPIGAPIPGKATTQVVLSGNLSADSTADQNRRVMTESPFQTGQPPVPASATTRLSDLSDASGAVAPGDTIILKGAHADGSQLSDVTIPIDATTTLGDIANAITANINGVTASVGSDGQLIVEATEVGVSNFAVELDNGPTVGGLKIPFADHRIATELQEGKLADTTAQTVDVFDERGERHEIELLFEKTGDDTWKLTTSIDPREGSIINGVVDQVTFNDDGSFRDASQTQIAIQLNGFAQPLTVDLGFTDPESGIGLNHSAAKTNVSSAQDGTGPGALASVKIDGNGVIKGIATNGRTVDIAQLAIASVSNPKGLNAIGDNLYEASLNSGEPEFGLAGSGDRGTLAGGQLESSNVDLAFEFTRLIVAQRGFSANARTITVSSDVLEELTNIVR